MAKGQFTVSGVSASPHVKCYKKGHGVHKRNAKMDDLILRGQHGLSVHHQLCSDGADCWHTDPFETPYIDSQLCRNSKLFLFILSLFFSAET